jgi:hypothetical protein
MWYQLSRDEGGGLLIHAKPHGRFVRWGKLTFQVAAEIGRVDVYCIHGEHGNILPGRPIPQTQNSKPKLEIRSKIGAKSGSAPNLESSLIAPKTISAIQDNYPV